MNRRAAEQITAEYSKPVFGFALRHCSGLPDAEDLAQEICLKMYRALLARDDIQSVEKFIWTIAHNMLANYYRGKQKAGIGLPFDDLSDIPAPGEDYAAGISESETVRKLQSEIAYLTKLQRDIIIAYYYENRKQDEIAESMGIPLGTVKWHLFEAKKSLKKGLETMRQTSELKFNPIKFEICGTSGSVGTKGGNGNFFRSALSQNIAYCVRRGEKSADEIGDALGVSPVYVESEADFLTEYGFLLKKGNRYAINILLDEPTAEIIGLHDKMYRRIAEVFANELFERLTESRLLDSSDILCAQTDHPLLADPEERADRNFILWSVIPYIAAYSGENLIDTSVSFEEAATIRPDGGQNVCQASVLNPDVKPPMYWESMKNWSGPMWNTSADFTAWQIDSEWSAHRADDNYAIASKRVLSLMEYFIKGRQLSRDDYAYLSEKGYLKTARGANGECKAAIQIVCFKNTEIRRRLIAVGDEIREKHKQEFETLKAPFVKAVLDGTPKHLRTMQEYGLQYVLHADGWFLLHCMKELVNSGKLKLPTENQKKSLTTVLIPNN